MVAGPLLPNTHYEGRDLEAMDLAVRYRGWIIDEFRPYVGDVVAEIGAGSGGFTRDLARLVGRRLIAVEPSGEQFPLLSKVELPGLEFVPLHGSLGEQAHAIGGALDTLIYTNVLEHVEDDAGELAQAAALLKPGGHLCIFVPALPALMSAFDRRIGHFRRYRRAGLEAIARGAGLEVVRLKYMDFVGIVPWYVSMKLMRGDLTPGRVRAYDTLVVPWLRAIERRVAPPIGKSLLLIARKPG